MISRHAIQVGALGVFVALAALPMARAAEPAPPVRPAISEEAATAVAQMGKTLSAKELSFTAKTIRVYLDQSGQPLHIFHMLKILVRRPNRLAVEVKGDDGSHDLFYDGKSVAVFSADRNDYITITAPSDIPSALNEVFDKLKVDFPLVEFFADSPDRAFLNGVIAGWQVGTANVDGVECRYLFFSRTPDIDLELWVQKNSEAIPRRLIVTYRLLPGQPNFIAEFRDWNTQVHPSDSEFAFQPPAGAKKIELGPAVVPAHEGSK